MKSDAQTQIKLKEKTDSHRHYSIGDNMSLYVYDTEKSKIITGPVERIGFSFTKKVRERAYSTTPMETRFYGFGLHLEKLDKETCWEVSYDRDLDELREPVTRLNFGRALKFEKLMLELMSEAENTLAPITGNPDVDFVKESIKSYRKWRKQNLTETLKLYTHDE